MKNYIYKITILFLACLVIACDDKTEDFKGPYSLIVTGSTAVAPGTTETYRLAPYSNPETYKWKIEGAAQIVGTATGLVVTVKFTSVGSVKLTVTNGVDAALVPITVEEVEPVVAVTLNGAGALKNLKKDTVFLSFAAPLVSTPVIKMLTASDSSHFSDSKKLAFASGSFSGSLVKVDASNYYVIYTAGTGNGTPEALITGMVSTAEYGSVKLDSAYIQLYRVDNIAPVVDLTYSTLTGNDGTVVTITAKFNEAVMFKGPSDKAIHLEFSGSGATETDTLKATSDPLVYTYEYTIDGVSDGEIAVDVTNVTDLAANDLSFATNSGGVLMVDNTGPVVSGSATDKGDFASIEISSTEKGTADYIILKSTAAVPTDAVSFFAADAIASSSSKVNAGITLTTAQSLENGSYFVYFISVDEAGNYSAIVKVPLMMN